MKTHRRLLVAPAAIAFLLVGIDGVAEAAPVLCRKKSGVVVVRDPACRKKETPLDLAQFGAVGPKGDKGDPGEPGPSLVAHTQNVESTWPISTTPSVVAVAGDVAGYSGSYSTPLVQPPDVTYMVVNVQARVADVTGTGVTCNLQSRADGGAWTEIAETAVVGSEGFLNASFPSFTPGTSWAIRLVCQTAAGNGTARGEIGVVAGVLS